ncbi:MAG: hypothetical protein U9R05_09095 [Chloroflexota bacterium]|nr:hypothetical protein [Chloroflexota bacterium]
MDLYIPTIEDVRAARRHRANRKNRDSFYYQARELVDQAIVEKSWPNVAEALGVVLKTWNKNYYHYTVTFDKKHVAEIACLIQHHAPIILSFRQRSIEAYSGTDEPTVVELFQDFEKVVGRVGAAKCLHLLAPSFFPLWDTKIAKGYGLRFRCQGENGSLYCRFMRITKIQYEALGGEQVIGPNPLKALDEWNYYKYTE